MQADEVLVFIKGVSAILFILFGTALTLSLVALAVYLSAVVFGKMSVLVILFLFIIAGFSLAVWLLFRIAKAEQTERRTSDAEQGDHVVELEIYGDE